MNACCSIFPHGLSTAMGWFLLCTALAGCASPIADTSSRTFFDDFEHGTDRWDLFTPHRIQVVASSDPAHGNVLALHPGGDNVYALIKGSEGWTNVRIESDVLFPDDEHNYLGLIYNYNVRGIRSDYGCVYIKGNGSYVRVNPHRDALVSRTVYEEYRTHLTDASAVETGVWQHVKAEVIGSTLHFYVGDMATPVLTFPYHEFTSGRVGFEPRVYGSEVWIDNVSVRPIEAFSYQGPPLPAGVTYTPEALLTRWDALGPFRRAQKGLPEAGYRPDSTYVVDRTAHTWQPFSADGRGAVITGRVFEFASMKGVAYFHATLPSGQATRARLRFSTTNALQVWINGHPAGTVDPSAFAWYDVAHHPTHVSGTLDVTLQTGANHLIVQAHSVGLDYTGDAFYAYLETGAGR